MLCLFSFVSRGYDQGILEKYERQVDELSVQRCWGFTAIVYLDAGEYNKEVVHVRTKCP
jgi:hypothetical protein